MKIFTSIFSLSALFSGVFSYDHDFELYRRTDAIIADLGPYLSPGSSIVLPTDNATLFAQLTKRHSQVFTPGIAVVVRVGSGDDVPKIIKYAKRNGRAIFAGSGRHGWGTSLNAIHDAIMIDIAPLTQITINSTANTMTVGGGVRIGGVMATLQAAGKEAATGICDCVGLLGATLGGGHGRLQGLHGLMADNLLSARLVTAAGDAITVSSTSHADLFWALRGAGHNFGIVTEAVYRIYDASNGGLQFSSNIVYHPDQLEALFTTMNEFVAPAGYNALVAVVPSPSGVPVINLGFVASFSAETAIPVLNSTFGHIPYLSRVDAMIPWGSVNGRGVLGRGASACGVGDRRNPSGVAMTHYDVPAVMKAYESFLEFTSDPRANTTLLLFESYSVEAVQRVPPGSTAYPHREERHIVLLTAGYLDGALDEAAEAWLKEMTGILHASSGFERPAVYMNYAQGTEDWGALYGYDKWRQNRLKELKRKWDPECVFSGYHPIPIKCR